MPQFNPSWNTTFLSRPLTPDNHMDSFCYQLLSTDTPILAAAAAKLADNVLSTCKQNPSQFQGNRNTGNRSSRDWCWCMRGWNQNISSSLLALSWQTHGDNQQTMTSQLRHPTRTLIYKDSPETSKTTLNTGLAFTIVRIRCCGQKVQAYR